MGALILAEVENDAPRGAGRDDEVGGGVQQGLPPIGFLGEASGGLHRRRLRLRGRRGVDCDVYLMSAEIEIECEL